MMSTSRNYKVMDSLNKIARRLDVPRWFFEYSQTLLMEVPLLFIESSEYQVRLARIQDLPELAECRQISNPEKGITLFNKRLNQDAYCYIIQDNSNHMLGYAWVMKTMNLFEDDDRLCITCPINGAYIFDTYLHPDSRGKGLYAILIAGLQHQMSEQGKKSFYVLVDKGNRASIRAHIKLGATILENIRYMTMLGISWYRMRTDTKSKYYLRLFHSHYPCDSLVLHPLHPHSFNLSITCIANESTMQSALERIKVCENDEESNTPFNSGEVVKVWWENDVKGKESLFLIEILNGDSDVVSYGFFRLYNDSNRLLHPRTLANFDDVYFMHTTLFTRKNKMRAIDIYRILSLPSNRRKIQKTSGADVLIWHRLPPTELPSFPRARNSCWNLIFESEYPILQASSTTSPLESAMAQHVLRDLKKQEKRMKNKFHSYSETTCINLAGNMSGWRKVPVSIMRNIKINYWLILIFGLNNSA